MCWDGSCWVRNSSLIPHWLQWDFPVCIRYANNSRTCGPDWRTCPWWQPWWVHCLLVWVPDCACASAWSPSGDDALAMKYFPCHRLEDPVGLSAVGSDRAGHVLELYPGTAHRVFAVHRAFVRTADRVLYRTLTAHRRPVRIV